MRIASLSGSAARIGLFGGTFDPFHLGHQALANAAQAYFHFDKLCFLPCGQPWQKGYPITTAQHRVAMLRLALAEINQPAWYCDARETERAAPATYTIDTLREFRQELGPQVQLIWLLGSDQMVNLPTWKNWQTLFEYAHFAYAQRAAIATFDVKQQPQLEKYWRPALPNTPAGTLCAFTMPTMPIAASMIRAHIHSGKSYTDLRTMLPNAVANYIYQHHLYSGL